jgi:hypothetical protein
LAGNAHSCELFDIGLGCSNLTSPPKLSTDHGDFYMYEPFTRASPYSGSADPISVNATVFWATFDVLSEHESD